MSIIYLFLLFLTLTGCYSDSNSISTDSRPIGAIPNDVVLAQRNGEIFALVVSSGDAELQIFNLSQPDSAPKALLFPLDEKKIGANPWSISLSHDQQRAAVSLYGQNKIALINPWSQKIIATAAPQYKVVLRLNQALRNPIDALNDGHSLNWPTHMNAKTPQGLAFWENYLVASFASHLEYAGISEEQPATFGPGTAALLSWVNDRLSYLDFVELPFQNPGAVVVDQNGQIWISCAGVFGLKDGRWQALTPGGLVRLELNFSMVRPKLQIAQTIPLNTFGGGKPVFSDKYIIVPSQNSAALWIGERSVTSFAEGTVINLGPVNQTDTTSVSLVGKNRIVITLFSSHKVLIYDLNDGGNFTKIENDLSLYEKSEAGSHRGAIASAFTTAGSDVIGAILLSLSAELVVTRW